MTTKMQFAGRYRPKLEANCPSCGCDSVFEHGGVQHWPKRVVEKLGVPEVVQLYHCGECHSTISETDLT